jgi:PIN domain nuclease of toxin-antitoxin system
MAAAMIQASERLRPVRSVLRHPQELGQRRGDPDRLCVRQALRRGVPLITMDADGQHAMPLSLHNLLASAGAAIPTA